MSQADGRSHYMKGDISKIPTPKVIYFFANSAKTGILALTNGKKKVHLHFNKGKLVYVTSSYFPSMSIGDYLASQGVILDDINQESKEEIKQSKQKQGEWLLERGLITPHQLYQALNEHVKIKLLSIFEWTEGEYYFRESGIIEPEYQMLNLDLPALIYEGVRDRMALDKMPREFRGRKESLLFMRPNGRLNGRDLPLKPAEHRLLDKLITCKLTLRQVVVASKLKPKQAYKVLYALFLLELIGFPENVGMTRSPGQPPTPTPPPAPKPGATRGYEIRIDDELLDQAMASVDRIKQEVVTGAAPGRPIEHDDAARLARAAESVEEVEIELAESEAPAPRRSAQQESEADEWEQQSAAPPERKRSAADELGLAEDAGWDKREPAAGAATTEPEPEPEPEPEIDLSDLDSMSLEELLQLGQDLINDQDYARAVEVLERARAADPELAEVYGFLGWAQFSLDTSHEGMIRAEQTIKQGIKLKPSLWQAYLFLGKIYRSMGEDEFAELHFVKCLEHKIDCQDARDEIRKIRTG